jgi:biopolymer transport protein ExbD
MRILNLEQKGFLMRRPGKPGKDMADITTDSKGGKTNGKSPRQRKKSTRIDMTAMVDVAFLLLTFFILTTTMAQSTAFELTTPDQKSPAPVPESKVMTIYLGENDQVHYAVHVNGSEQPTVESTNFSDGGIRNAIQDHLNRFPNRCPKDVAKEEILQGRCWDPIIVLKPMKASKYRNVVDILDEMQINGVRKYALAKVTAEDSLLMLDHGLR